MILVRSLSGINNKVISILPRCVHFPTNFQQPLAAKLLIGSKKLGRGSKNGTDLLYHHAKYGGDCGSRAGYRPESVMFFLFLTLSNDKVCDNGNAIKHCNCQNNYSIIA